MLKPHKVRKALRERKYAGSSPATILTHSPEVGRICSFQ